MSNTTDLIIAFSSVFTPISVFLIGALFYLERERSKKIKAWEVMQEWEKRQSHAMSAASVIVESLNKEDLSNLCKQKAFKLKKAHLHLVKKCLDDPGVRDIDPILEQTDDEVIIKSEIAAEIRWHTVQFLCAIESVMVAWSMGIVSSEIVCLEMKPQLDIAEKLKDFTEETGGENGWPCIYKFHESQSKGGIVCPQCK